MRRLTRAVRAHSSAVLVSARASGLGQDLFVAMSHLRGGNAFTVTDDAGAAALMQESWPWRVSPVAYDLHLAVTPSPGDSVADSYGFPGSDPATPSLDVSTVFRSNNRGALLVRLANTGAA